MCSEPVTSLPSLQVVTSQRRSWQQLPVPLVWRPERELVRDVTVLSVQREVATVVSVVDETKMSGASVCTMNEERAAS